MRAILSYLLCCTGLLCGLGCSGSDVAVDGDPDGDESSVVAVAFPKSRRVLDPASCIVTKGTSKVLFLDADSTLRVAKSGGVTADTPDDVDILPFVAGFIKAKRKEGYLAAIVSNQGGISVGKQTFSDAEGALVFTATQLAKLGAQIDYIDFAEAKDEFRKPEIGMEENVRTALLTTCKSQLDVPGSLMVGDSAYKAGEDGPSPDGRAADDFSNSDRLFAEHAKLRFQEPTDAFGWREFGIYNVLGETELIAFLAKIEAASIDLKSSNPARSRAFHSEVTRLRAINGLTTK